MTTVYKVKGQLEKEETSFGCGYKIVLELNLGIIIAMFCRCGSDIPEYAWALGNALTNIVMKISLYSLVYLITIKTGKTELMQCKKVNTIKYLI